MNHKLTMAVIGILACGSAQAQALAAAPAAAPSISLTATGAVASQYMFRGQRLSGAAFQPTVEAAAGSLTLGVWGNFPFDGDKVPDSSDPEIDIYGSYSIPFGKDLALAPGFTTYLYPKAPTGAGFYRTTFEPNLALSYTIEGIKLTPKVCYDFVLEGPTYEVTAAYAIPLKEIGSELGFTATLGTFLLKDAANGASPAVKSWLDYWLLGVSMPFQLTKDSKLVLAFAYTEGRRAFTKAGNLGKSPNLLAIGRGVVTIGYSVSF